MDENTPLTSTETKAACLNLALGARSPRGGTRPRDRGTCRRLLRPARGRGRTLRLTHACTAPRGRTLRPWATPTSRTQSPRPRPRPHPRGCRGEPAAWGRVARPAPPAETFREVAGLRAGGGRRPPASPRARVRARARRGLLPMLREVRRVYQFCRSSSTQSRSEQTLEGAFRGTGRRGDRGGAVARWREPADSADRAGLRQHKLATHDATHGLDEQRRSTCLIRACSAAIVVVLAHPTAAGRGSASVDPASTSITVHP